MHRLSVVIILVFSALCSGNVVAAEELTAGKDYGVVSPPVPAAGEGKVQVVELFWYGCPHCYHFDPVLDDWLENKPANVEFVRIPAVFNNPRWKLHAQAFYTAEVLEITNRFHKRFFAAVQEKRQRMASKDEIRNFFEQLDVNAETFNDTFDSFAVEAKVRRAADLSRKYGIGGVPALIVNGKYRIEADMAKSYQHMNQIMNELIARESK